jgi:Uma2 family endonuclease
MQIQIQPRYYTPQEYLALEATAEQKSEYYGGEIIPMTGGSINHNRITGNIYAFLKYQLRGKGKEAFTCDLRLWIKRYQCYVYPDVLVIEGNPDLHDDRTDTITNPCLIIEVLSKSTQNYDHTEKLGASRFLKYPQAKAWGYTSKACLRRLIKSLACEGRLCTPAGTQATYSDTLLGYWLNKWDAPEKFRYYRSIPHFQEYLLINQYEYSVEHYRKTDEGEWLLREYETENAKITLSSIGVEIAITDIYEGVNLNG